MLYGIYQSAAGLQANQYALDVLANNMANASTTGFKHDLALVRERQIQSREQLTDASYRNDVLDGMSGGTLVSPTFTSLERGPVEPSNRPLDVAIDGDGFFAVQAGKEIRYTRDGRFTLNKAGELVTEAGKHAVLDAQGRPMVVGAKTSGPLQIDADGEVKAGKQSIGRLGIVEFDDLTRMRKTGGNLMQALGMKPREVGATLKVGAVEGSTVDPTTTLVQMMQATRAYELNARMVGVADSTLGRAVNDIARIS